MADMEDLIDVVSGGLAKIVVTEESAETLVQTISASSDEICLELSEIRKAIEDLVKAVDAK